MNKAELVEHIVKDTGATKAMANNMLDSFMKAVSGSLKKEESVTLIGFGTFSVTKREARTGRNPQTGEPLKIKAKKMAKFKPGKALAETVAKAKAKK